MSRTNHYLWNPGDLQVDSENRADLIPGLIERFTAAGGNVDWYEALLYAALDEHDQDLEAAIKAADAAFAGHPEPPTEEDGDGLLEDVNLEECGGEGGKPGPCPTGRHQEPTKGRPSAAPKTAPKVRSRVPEEQPTEKAARAKAAHKMVDKTIQRYAEEHNEPQIAAALGGVSFPDSEPMDIAIAGNAKHKEKWAKEAERWKAEKAAGKNPPDKMDTTGPLAHAVEMKTVVDNSNGKITMDSYSQIRKLNMEKERGATFHTIVVDDSRVFNAKGPGQHDESKRRIFYRRGVAGSARYEGMHQAKDMNEVRKLMSTPEKNLPAAAQRTDSELRAGNWKPFQDKDGKGFKDTKSDRIVRAKK